MSEAPPYSQIRTRTVIGSYGRAIARSTGTPYRGTSLIIKAPPPPRIVSGP